MFIEEQSLSKEDTSSEGSDIPNPFESDDEEISYTDLRPIDTFTPATLGDVLFSKHGDVSLEAMPTPTSLFKEASTFFTVPHAISPTLPDTPSASGAGVQFVLPSPAPVTPGKHPMRSLCACKKNCIDVIPQERREVNHATYWSANYNERRNWLPQHRSKSEMAKSHHNYFVANTDGVRKEVCLRFFLNTLGYSSNSVTESLQRSGASDISLFAPPDKRKHGKKPHALKEATIDCIDGHIEQFNPSVSHYRREHAPNRRYISSDITINEMFSIFRECELCLLFEQHEHQPGWQLHNMQWTSATQKQSVCLSTALRG